MSYNNDDLEVEEYQNARLIRQSSKKQRDLSRLNNASSSYQSYEDVNSPVRVSTTVRTKNQSNLNTQPVIMEDDEESRLQYSNINSQMRESNNPNTSYNHDTFNPMENSKQNISNSELRNSHELRQSQDSNQHQTNMAPNMMNSGYSDSNSRAEMGKSIPIDQIVENVNGTKMRDSSKPPLYPKWSSVI